MKNIILLLVFTFILAFNSQAQKVNKSFTNTTVAGDTVNLSLTKLIETSKGVVIYDFTTTDVADSLAFARIEASNDNLNWVPLNGNASVAATSTDGAKQVYKINDLLHLYYRLSLGAATGDTVTITNARVIFKEE